MKNLLEKLVLNDTLFTLIIVFLCLLLITVIFLLIRSMRTTKINIYEEELEDEEIKKVKNVKKEDIIDTPISYEKKSENIFEEQFENIYEHENENEFFDLQQKYEEEKKQEIEEEKDVSTNDEIIELLDQMEQDSKITPEDVVSSFEKEQEEQSIISYQELVSAVKNRQEEYYEDELEGKPLAKVSDFIRNDNFEDIDPKEMIDNIITTADNSNSEQTKFKKTEIISPIYGRIEDTSDIDYPKISKIKDNDVALNMPDKMALTGLADIYNHMAADLERNDSHIENKNDL